MCKYTMCGEEDILQVMTLSTLQASALSIVVVVLKCISKLLTKHIIHFLPRNGIFLAVDKISQADVFP